MHILQILQDASTDPSMYNYIGVGSGIGATAGTIITMLVGKLLNKKKDDVDITDVINQQVRMLFETGEFKDKVIKELQDAACFRNPCRIRINGNEPIKPLKKKTA